MTKKQYTVFGSPINHSLSPLIHSEFAKQFDIALEYSTTESSIEQFSQKIDQFRKAGGLGANVTVPLKEVAFKLCDITMPHAKQALAVNTLYWDQDGRLCGDNTDGEGFLRDIKNNYHLDLSKKSILLIGAGGAARGILGPILKEKPTEVVLANRNKVRAEKLAENFNHSEIIPLSIETLNLARKGQHFDIVINATSASLAGEILPISEQFVHNAFVYDLAYDLVRATPFVHWALRHNAKEAVDGLGMLLEQAAGAFYIWHQQRPKIEPVRLMLKSQ